MKKLIITICLFNLYFLFAIDKYVDIDMIYKAGSPRYLEEGFLLTLPNDTGYRIFLRMNADNWQKDYYYSKNLFGVWCLYIDYEDISANGITTMQYKLNIDGYWDNDPNNEAFIYDKYHAKISVLDLPDNQNNHKTAMPIIKKQSPFKSTVTFKYYNPDAKNVNLVCSNTNWSIFSNDMKLDKFGYWTLDISVGSGTFYYYFLADWEKTLDNLNPNHEYDATIGEVNKFVVD